MPKRRSRGEGTIYQRKDGLWCGQITMPDGKRKTKYAASQRTVRLWLEEQRGFVRQGTWSTRAEITLGDFLERYLADVAAHNVRVQTLRNYERSIKNHVLPSLGKMKLAALRADHLQKLYADLADKGLAPGTILIAHGVLRQALNQAELWNLIGRNPAALVRRPGRKNRPPDMLSDEQLKQVLAVIRGHWLYTLIILAVTTGLRRGELLGLTWQDIDFENRLLYVRKGVIEVDREVVLADPKTEASRRKVTLPGVAVDALREHTAILDQRASKYKWTENDLIFPNRSGHVMTPGVVNTLWREKLAQLGMPDVTFHSLRHLHSTMLLEAGVSPKVVQERLGHASIAITLGIYSHVSPTLERQAADVIEKSLTTA